MFRIILNVAGENKLRRIDKVNVVIGEYLQIKPSLFEFAFEAAKEGTIAAGADLNIELQPVELECEQCGQTFLLREIRYKCRFCGSGRIEIIKGKELFIKSLEGA